MPRRHFDDGWKMIRLPAIHRSHDRNIVNHTPDLREPIRYRNAGLSIPSKLPVAGNHRTPHRREVVSKTNGINKLALPTTILGIEGIDMTHPATHEEEDNRLHLRLTLSPPSGKRRGRLLGPQTSQGTPEETTRRFKKEPTPRNRRSGRPFTIRSHRVTVGR